MTSVLIADDDPSLREVVTTLLEASGYEVTAVGSLAEALDRFPRAHPDLLIVDLHMPGGGMALVEAVSRDTSVPVMVLSGDDQESMKVASLDSGAEDYVTKPFSAAELLARIRAILRRSGRGEESVQAGPLLLSSSTRSVSAAGGRVDLTPTEFDLLRALAASEGFVTTNALLAEVWGPSYRSEQEYVRAYIRRLRSKLGRLGQADLIESRPGLGYRLNVADGG